MDQVLAEPELQSPTQVDALNVPDPKVRLAHPLVQGHELDGLPEDLYIPPDALLIFLEAFEGPLDLLLYLIKKNNLNILDIPIANITMQYMEYVEIMKAIRLELAAEYLVMAAMLAEIKSRMLLPRSGDATQEEMDPRAELVRRLQEYERFRFAAEEIGQMPALGKDYFLGQAAPPMFDEVQSLPPQIDLKALAGAFMDILQRSQTLVSHTIEREPLSVRERMSRILSLLQDREHVLLENCFTLKEGRMGVIVTFMALLELLKERMIEVIQTEPFGPIHLKANEDDENCE